MNKDVKKYIGLLRDIEKSKLSIVEEELLIRRMKWFEDNLQLVSELEGDELEKAYRLLLLKLDITEEEARIVRKNKSAIVFHSSNFCPSLEACEVLGLDTRGQLHCIFTHDRLEDIGQIAAKRGCRRAVCVENSGSIMPTFLPQGLDGEIIPLLRAPNFRPKGRAVLVIELDDEKYESYSLPGKEVG